MIVREATPEDLHATALVVAEVAPEGSLAAQPPVDLDEWIERFRRTVESEGLRGCGCSRTMAGSSAI